MEVLEEIVNFFPTNLLPSVTAAAAAAAAAASESTTVSGSGNGQETTTTTQLPTTTKRVLQGPNLGGGLSQFTLPTPLPQIPGLDLNFKNPILGLGQSQTEPSSSSSSSSSTTMLLMTTTRTTSCTNTITVSSHQGCQPSTIINNTNNNNNSNTNNNNTNSDYYNNTPRPQFHRRQFVADGDLMYKPVTPSFQIVGPRGQPPQPQTIRQQQQQQRQYQNPPPPPPPPPRMFQRPPRFNFQPGNNNNNTNNMATSHVYERLGNPILPHPPPPPPPLIRHLTHPRLPGHRHQQVPTRETLDRHVLDLLTIEGRGSCFVYKARFSYNPKMESPNKNPEDELQFSAGDFILVWGKTDADGFLRGELLNGKKGWVPSNYVRKIVANELVEFWKNYVQGNLMVYPEDQFGCLIDDEFFMDARYASPPVDLVVERRFHKSVLIGWKPPKREPEDVQYYKVCVQF